MNEQNDRGVTDGKFKKVLLWSIYFFGLGTLVVFLIVPLAIQMYGDIFHPDNELGGISDTLVGASIFLSIASVALGAYSVWQMNSGSKVIENAVNKIDEIRRSQVFLERYFFRKPNVVIEDVDMSGKEWEHDRMPDENT